MKLFVENIRSNGRIAKTESTEPKRLLPDEAPMVQFKDPIDVSVEAQMANTAVYVKGAIKTIIHYTCSRCLKDFSQPFQGTFQQTFDAAQPEIDLSGDIRETLLIDLPMKPLCRPDCEVNGLGSDEKPGVYREDSRMDQAFKKIRFKS